MNKLEKNSIEDYFLPSLGTFKEELLEELEIAKYKNLEDMVYRMQLTYVDFMDKLDLKYIPSKRTSYILPPGLYEGTDIDTILNHFFLIM